MNETTSENVTSESAGLESDSEPCGQAEFTPGSEPGAEARSFKTKLSQRNATYWASFTLALTLPPALEILSGSAVGPSSHALIVLLWTPWVVLTFLGLRCKRDSWIAAMPLVLIFMITALNWPANPPMDILRQLTHEAEVAIIGWAMAAYFLRAVMDLWPRKKARP